MPAPQEPSQLQAWIIRVFVGAAKMSPVDSWISRYWCSLGWVEVSSLDCGDVSSLDCAVVWCFDSVDVSCLDLIGSASGSSSAFVVFFTRFCGCGLPSCFDEVAMSSAVRLSLGWVVPDAIVDDDEFWLYPLFDRVAVFYLMESESRLPVAVCLRCRQPITAKAIINSKIANRPYPLEAQNKQSRH